MKIERNEKGKSLGNSITIMLLSILVIYNYFVQGQKSFELVGIMLLNYAISELATYKESGDKCDLVAGISLAVMGVIFCFFFILNILHLY